MSVEKKPSTKPQDEHRLVAERQAKIGRLRAQNIDPYPLRWKPTCSIADAVSRGDAENGRPLSLAGRITALRDLGKMAFADLSSNGAKIQVQLREDVLQTDYLLLRNLDLGDFVGVTGPTFRTRRGELTVEVQKLTVLGKALRPMPDKWAGLKDPEERRRHRYLDLASNPNALQIAAKRAKIVTATRSFMDSRGFMEFETPILNPVAAGAMARPFATHYNALNRDWYLRIATELPLKKLMVGGFERVYELGRVFRNEGVDRSHNPEFTTMEGYWAYSSYEDIMCLIEEMCAFVALEVNGTTVIEPPDGKGEIDLKPPWKRVSLRDQLRRHAGVDFVELRTRERLIEVMRDRGMPADYNASWGKLIDKVIGHAIEPTLREPTFLTDYPVETTPFAKQIKGSDGIVERAEGFALGVELVNIFTELNDPVAQKARLEEQERLGKQYGDSEADRLDSDFIMAVEYGMPPAGGFGIGIDRLAMLIAGVDSIRDILLFPSLKD